MRASAAYPTWRRVVAGNPQRVEPEVLSEVSRGSPYGAGLAAGGTPVGAVDVPRAGLGRCPIFFAHPLALASRDGRQSQRLVCSFPDPQRSGCLSIRSNAVHSQQEKGFFGLAVITWTVNCAHVRSGNLFEMSVFA